MVGQIYKQRKFVKSLYRNLSRFLKKKKNVKQRDETIDRFSFGSKIFCEPSIKRIKNKNISFNILETSPEISCSLKNEREISEIIKKILSGDLINQKQVSASDFSVE